MTKRRFPLLVLALSPVVAQASTVPPPAGMMTWGYQIANTSGPDFTQSITSPTSVSLSHSDNTPTLNQNNFAEIPSSVNDTVYATYGTIKVLGEGSGQSEVNAIGRFRDALTFTSPGIPNGTPGKLTYSVSVSGNLAAGADPGSQQAGAFASWDLQTLLSTNDEGLNGPYPTFPNMEKCGTLASYTAGVNAADYGYTKAICLSNAVAGDPFGTYSVTVPIVWGDTYWIDVRLDITTSSTYDTSTNATVDVMSDLSHSLYWGGITNVTANGSPVGSFNVVSGSGTNYANSLVPNTVPEPGSMTLLAAGLLAAVGGVKKARARR